MKIQDVLNKKVMLFDLKATDKEGVINEMIQSLVDNGVVTDFETFKAGIMNREAQTSTGLGDGIAMPHSKNEAVKKATVLFAKSNKGVDYASLDGQPTDLFFMIAAPEGANDTHLAALAELSKYLMKPGFADKLRQASNPDQVIAGSALTGALVGLAGLKLMAPHGGIFVIALTSNPLLYIVFVLIGAVVSGILFGLLRKPKN